MDESHVLAALQAACGRISFAAERLGCSVDDLLQLARRSPRVRQVLAQFNERLLDTAEAALWKGVLDRESWAVRLVLETHGTRRGYGEGDASADNFLARSGAATIQEVLAVLLENDDYLEYCRTRASAEPAVTVTVCQAALRELEAGEE